MVRRYRFPIIVGLALFLAGVGVGAWLLLSGDPESGISEGPPAISVTSLTKFPEGDPWFSPSGDAWLTRGRSSSGESLYRVTLPTGATVELDDAIAADWRPDGGLAVYRAAGPPEEGRIASLYSISLADADLGGESPPVATTDDLGNIGFDAAGSIYYLRDGTLYMWDAVAEREERVGAFPIDGLASPAFGVSPDGERVAYVADQVLRILNVATGDTEVITREVDMRQAGPFAWSPDGGRLAYSTQDPASRHPSLHVISLEDGTRNTILTANQSGSYSMIVWHPTLENTLLAKLYGFGTDPEDRAEYLAVNATSGEYTSLFTGGLGLRLSPDGTKISFMRTSLKAMQTGDYGAWVAQLSVG